LPAVVLLNQKWWDIFNNDITSKNPHSKSPVAQECAQHLLGSALEQQGIDLNKVLATTPSASLSDAEAQKILWQLTGLNFKFKFLALDRYLGPTTRDEVNHQHFVQELLQIRLLIVADE
jgi:hypothetical protein